MSECEDCKVLEPFGHICPYHQGFIEGWDACAETVATCATRDLPIRTK